MANLPRSDDNKAKASSVSTFEFPANRPATTDNGSINTVQTAGEEIDFDNPELYLNRELTWLAFNSRVLSMADDPNTPLLERVKFLAIISDTSCTDSSYSACLSAFALIVSALRECLAVRFLCLFLADFISVIASKWNQRW